MFDPFGDFESAGYLRNMSAEKDLSVVKAAEHTLFRAQLPEAITEPAYAERRSRSAIDNYSFQLSAMLKTEAARSRKQRRTLKQLRKCLASAVWTA